jgi:hypothetical protein
MEPIVGFSPLIVVKDQNGKEIITGTTTVFAEFPVVKDRKMITDFDTFFIEKRTEENDTDCPSKIDQKSDIEVLEDFLNSNDGYEQLRRVIMIREDPKRSDEATQWVFEKIRAYKKEQKQLKKQLDDLDVKHRRAYLLRLAHSFDLQGLLM